MNRRRVAFLTSGLVTVLALASVAAIALSKQKGRPVHYGNTALEYAPRPGSVRIEARAMDPGGDAPWVVRVWRTRDNTQACEQLGREVDGVVGDVGFDGRFRPLKFGERTICSPRVLDTRAPLVQVGTFLDDPLDDRAKPLRTVAWGMAGPKATKVVIDGPGGARTAPLTPLRAWVDVRDGNIPTYRLATTVHYRNGQTQTVDYGRARRPSRHPVAGSVTVEARAKAPRGGPDFAVLAWRTANGSSCFTQGRALGDDRVGSWDTSGTFFDYPIGEGAACSLPGSLTRDQPVAFSFGSGVGSPAVLAGVAMPEVEKIVVEGLGPRRELTPGPHGGVLALFSHARGHLRQRAVFKDGTSKELYTLNIHPVTGRAPSKPALSRVGPRVVAVAADGSFTLVVSCPANSRGRKCMSSLQLQSARSYRRTSGLAHHEQMASRLVRLAPGTEERPLRLRLTRRARALLAREHSIPVVARDSYGTRSKRVFHLRLVEQSATVAPYVWGTRITVHPGRVVGPHARVSISYRAPYPSKGPHTRYATRLWGPAGDCRRRALLSSGGISWHPTRTPRRPTIPPADPSKPETWCPGRFRGDVTFVDETGGRTLRRVVGSFSFTVQR
jgi:hypothetical protein